MNLNRNEVDQGAPGLNASELNLISFSSTAGTITKDGQNYQYECRDKNHNDGNFHSYQQKAYQRNKLTEQSDNQKNESGYSA
jgi:hypothetical protein